MEDEQLLISKGPAKPASRPIVRNSHQPAAAVRSVGVTAQKADNAAEAAAVKTNGSASNGKQMVADLLDLLQVQKEGDPAAHVLTPSPYGANLVVDYMDSSVSSPIEEEDETQLLDETRDRNSCVLEIDENPYDLVEETAPLVQEVDEGNEESSELTQTTYLLDDSDGSEEKEGIVDLPLDSDPPTVPTLINNNNNFECLDLGICL